MSRSCDNPDSIETRHAEYSGRHYAIYLEYEMDRSNPRKDMDNLGHMVCWHDRDNLGDEQPRESPEEWLKSLAYQVDPHLEERAEFWDNAGYERLRDAVERDATTSYTAEQLTKFLARTESELGRGLTRWHDPARFITDKLEIAPEYTADPALAAYIEAMRNFYQAVQTFGKLRGSALNDEEVDRALQPYEAAMDKTQANLAAAWADRPFKIGAYEASRQASAKAEAKVKQLIERALEKVELLPLYLYEHSGQTMSTGSFNDPWDSGQVGWIYVTPEDIIKEYGSDTPEHRAQARQVLEGEVKTYAQYLEGDVYVVFVYDVTDAYNELLAENGEVDIEEIDLDDGEQIEESPLGDIYGDDYAWQEGHDLAKADAESKARAELDRRRAEGDRYAARLQQRQAKYAEAPVVAQSAAPLREGRKRGYNAEQLVRAWLLSADDSQQPERVWHGALTDDETHYEKLYIDKASFVMPSQAYYGRVNATPEETAQDAHFTEALQRAAKRHGCWIEITPAGGGRPAYLFLCRNPKVQKEGRDEQGTAH